ncbi:unnamed protein product [Schistosoma turkestanicum]|nr:unnamed protein product [Schistosoma turkestanicum]
MRKKINYHYLLLTVIYITFNLISLQNGQFEDMDQRLDHMINSAEKQARNVTTSNDKEETMSRHNKNDFETSRSSGKYFKRKRSRKQSGKRYEGVFYSRGHSIYGDIDSKTTTFHYGGKIKKYGRRHRTFSDKDTTGTSDRYASSYIKDDFKIRAKSAKQYVKGYKGLSDMAREDRSGSVLFKRNNMNGKTVTNLTSTSRDVRNTSHFTQETRNN